MSEYRTLARVYDILLKPFLSGMRHKILEIAETLKPEKVVDLCGGTGEQLKMMMKAGINSTCCVDTSHEMLRIAERGRNAPKCVLADAADTGLQASSADLVIISLALHEKTFEKGSSVLAEAHRILKTGAVLIAADYSVAADVPSFAAGIISFVESFVGGEHYANYRYYIRTGGLKTLIDPELFELSTRYYAAAGGIAIEVLKALKKKGAPRKEAASNL